MYSAALPQTVGALGSQQDSKTVFIGSYERPAAEYIDLSDFDLEQWFSRHRSELVSLTSLDIAPIAAWLHAIGPPANDNACRQDWSAKSRPEPKH